ncbi:hypothetical protein D9M71_200940 [compost metagenome]
MQVFGQGRVDGRLAVPVAGSIGLDHADGLVATGKLGSARWWWREHEYVFLGEHATADGLSRVGAALGDQGRGQLHLGKLAGDGEQVGAHVDSAWAFDAYIVGVERAAGDLLQKVRITDEGVGAALGVGFGIRALDTAQEWAHVTAQGAVIGFRCAHANVAGHVDGSVAVSAEIGGGDIEHFHAIGVGNGVYTGGGHIDPDANAGKAYLVTFIDSLCSKCRFDGSAEVQVDTRGRIDDRCVCGEPERFIGEVTGEFDRQIGVELVGCRWNRAHECRCARCPCYSGADVFGKTEFGDSPMGILIPGSEGAEFRLIGTRVDSIQRCHG